FVPTGFRSCSDCRLLGGVTGLIRRCGLGSPRPGGRSWRLYGLAVGRGRRTGHAGRLLLRAFRFALLDRLGYDPDAITLVVVAGRESDFVPVGRVTGSLDRQGQVVELFVDSLITLRIQAVV